MGQSPHKLLLILLPLLTSCGATVTVALPALPSYDFWIDPSMSEQTRTAISEAVTEWETYTDVAINVHQGHQVCANPGCFYVTENSLSLLDTATDTDWTGWTT